MRELAAPLQARSEQALARILAAATELVEELPFEAVTVAQIAERARTSVGNVYERFPDKQAILEELHRRYEAERTETLTARLEREAAADLDLRARVTALVGIFADFYAGRPGLIRSFVLRYRNRPDEVTEKMRARLDDLYGRAEKLLLERRSEMARPQPEAAVRTGLFLVAAACRDRFLFSSDPHASRVPFAVATLRRELAAALLAYLTYPEVPDAPPPDAAPAPRRRARRV